MAVEDDPRYPRWRAALEMLIAAREVANSLKDLPESNPERRRAEAELAAAKLAYNAIADEV